MRHKRTFFWILFIFLYSFSITLAVPPTTKYQPGATLDPTCAPGDTNCSVQILPDQTSNANKYLTTDGSSTAWSSSTLVLGGNFQTSGAYATTLTATGTTTLTLPTSGTLYGTLTDSITSSQLLTSLSDETGTGLAVFATAPSFTTSISTPSIITASGALGITPASGSNLNITLATTGDFAVNTNQLYVDTSTGNVGVGTTGPGSKLQVVGSTGTDITNVQAGAGIFVSNGGSTGVAIGSEGNVNRPVIQGVGAGAALNLLINPYGGNVGFGTISPTSKLEVTGDIRITSGSGGQIIFADGSTMSSSGLGSAAALSSTTDAIVTGDSDANASGDVILKTGSNDRLHILNSGNVGINTATPSALFSVGATSPFQVTNTGAVTALLYTGAGTGLTGTAASLTAGNVTTNANLTGHITSAGNAAVLGTFTSSNLLTALSDETGTGLAVFATSPILITPNIGVATGTSLDLSSGAITSGLINGQTISSAANFTGTGAFAGSVTVNLSGASLRGISTAGVSQSAYALFQGTNASSVDNQGYVGINVFGTDGSLELVNAAGAGLKISQTAGAATFTGDTTLGNATAATNVSLNINSVLSKAARIQFQQSGVSKWLIGNGAASENNNFELYNSTGVVVLSVDKTTSVSTFGAAITAGSNSITGGAASFTTGAFSGAVLGGYGSIFNGASSNYFRIGKTDATANYLQTNVGAGTTSLEVGDITASFSIATGNAIRYTLDASGNNTWTGSGSFGATVTVPFDAGITFGVRGSIKQDASYNYVWATNSLVNAMQLTPAGALTIQGALTGTSATFSGVVTINNNQMQVTNGTIINQVSFTTASGGSGLLGTTSNHAVNIQTNGTNALTIDSNQTVTFSNSSAQQLVLNSTNVSGSYFQFNRSGTPYGYIGNAGPVIGTNTDDFAIRAEKSLRFTTNEDTSRVAALTLSSTGAATFAGSGTFGDVVTLNGGGAKLSFLNTASSNYFGLRGSTNILISNTDVGDIAQIAYNTGTYTALSDVNKKKNFEAYTGGLVNILALKSTLYNMKDQADGTPKELGFIAQEVRDVIPQAYVENGDFIGLNYSAFTPVIVKAIQEMNLKIEGINNMSTENSWRESLIAWLANAENHITRVFTGEICLTDPGQQAECINRTELQSLKALLNESQTPTPPPADPTCFDNIQNQDETGVDTGGVCVPTSEPLPVPEPTPESPAPAPEPEPEPTPESPAPAPEPEPAPAG